MGDFSSATLCMFILTHFILTNHFTIYIYTEKIYIIYRKYIHIEVKWPKCSSLFAVQVNSITANSTSVILRVNQNENPNGAKTVLLSQYSKC